LVRKCILTVGTAIVEKPFLKSAVGARRLVGCFSSCLSHPKEVLIQYKSHPTLHTACVPLFKQNCGDAVPMEASKIDEQAVKEALRTTYAEKKRM
jgi:hypothetical protein